MLHLDITLVKIRGLNRLSGRLGTAKLEQDAIEQKKLADNLEDSLNRLIIAETNLEKAASLSQ